MLLLLKGVGDLGGQERLSRNLDIYFFTYKFIYIVKKRRLSGIALSIIPGVKI